jgi:hypothetical protein
MGFINTKLLQTAMRFRELHEMDTDLTEIHKAVGKRAFDLLIDVCINNLGIENIEKRYSLTPRSAKELIRLTLEQINDKLSQFNSRDAEGRLIEAPLAPG